MIKSHIKVTVGPGKYQTDYWCIEHSLLMLYVLQVIFNIMSPCSLKIALPIANGVTKVISITSCAYLLLYLIDVCCSYAFTLICLGVGGKRGGGELMFVDLSKVLTSAFASRSSQCCNKGHGMCYPVCGMVHIKRTLAVNQKE